MMPPHWIPSATAHLAHISASASAGGSAPEKRSPPPQPSPPAPTPPPAQTLTDPDTPLNLSKPKSNASSGSGSAGSSPHAHHQINMHGISEQPVAATTPKLLPPNLVMPRAFLPYAGLPPHLSPLPPNVDRQKMGQNATKDGIVSPDKQPHFPMHMYGLQHPSHLTSSKQLRDDSTVGKEEADFMAACHSKYIFSICIKIILMQNIFLNYKSLSQIVLLA